MPYTGIWYCCVQVQHPGHDIWDDRHAFRHKHDITTRATESCCTTTHMLVRPVQIASSATPMRRLSSKSWCQHSRHRVALPCTAKPSRGWAHQCAVVHAAGDPCQRGKEDGQDADRDPSLQASHAMALRSSWHRALQLCAKHRLVSLWTGSRISQHREHNAVVRPRWVFTSVFRLQTQSSSFGLSGVRTHALAGVTT